MRDDKILADLLRRFILHGYSDWEKHSTLVLDDSMPISGEEVAALNRFLQEG